LGILYLGCQQQTGIDQLAIEVDAACTALSLSASLFDRGKSLCSEQIEHTLVGGTLKGI
jgi:hypothetical protein